MLPRERKYLPIDKYCKGALKAYNPINECDFLCSVSETFSAALDDRDLMIKFYNLVQSDRPSNIKRGGNNDEFITKSVWQHLLE